MKYARNQYLTAIRLDGVVFAPNNVGDISLANNTYYIELGSTDAPFCEESAHISVHLFWSAALAAVVTFEWTNFPATRGNQSQQGAVDVSSFNNAGLGAWVQDNDAVGDKVSVPIGAGNTVTNLTLTLGGTNAGAFGVQLKDRSARRYRLKIVSTVGGSLRAVAHGKLGA